MLSGRGVSCTVACEGRGLECDLDTTLSLSSATDGAMLTAIDEAGGSCTSVTGWGYASGPGICTHPTCCGGNCVGICTKGKSASASCEAVNYVYTRLCYCKNTPASSRRLSERADPASQVIAQPVNGRSPRT